VVSWTEVFDLASRASAGLQILRGTVFAALFCAPAFAHGAPSPHRGASLVRIEVADGAALAMIAAAGIEPWADHPRPPRVLARVPAGSRAWLDASGLPYEVVVTDLEVAIEAERQRLAGRTAAAGTPLVFEEYRDLAEIDAHLDALAASNPDEVGIVQIGTSIEGRAIRGLRIERSGAVPKPLVVVNGTQHAREWIAAMSTLYVADLLVTESDSDLAIDTLLDDVAVLVVPVVNPDGYVHTWVEDRFWRKNRRGVHGVDLNRNYAVAWGGEGSSAEPEDGNYHGTAPLSEPEAVALAELLDDEPTLVAVLDVHSFGQLVLSPWSFTLDPPPAGDVLAPFGVTIAAWMGEPWHTEYTPQQAADLYLAAGTWPDHAYGARGAWAYTLELRPADAEMFTDGFVLPAEVITECGDEVLAALGVLAPHAAEAGRLPAGDDGDAPGPVDPDGEGTTAAVGDTSTGGDDATASTGSPAPEPPAPTPSGSSTGPGPDTGEPDPESASGPRIDEVSASCACRSSTPRQPMWLWLVVLGIVAARPRTRSAGDLFG
jgi:hypothetical protein